VAYNTLLTAPVNLTWEITDKCNLQCRHCLSLDVRRQSKKELNFRECVKLIDELDSMKVFQINFGGGEPFLREDFLDILAYAHNKAITTCVSTNGTILNETLVKKLKKMELLNLQVSLDGATPETNDQIRGKGTYQNILSGIELLAKHHISHWSINTVVTRINFREIIQLYELAQHYGAKTRLSRFRPAGNGKRAWEMFHLDRTQLLELSSFLSEHKDVLTGDSFFAITAQDRQQLGLNMCGAAKMTCSVSPDGSVYPCAFLQDKRFLAGNILNDSLSSIWKNAKAFHIMRSIHVESCRNCQRFHICHGGCPAVAFFMTQSLEYHDPECLYHIQEGIRQRDCDENPAIAIHN